jgi:hypothetical protein
MRITATWNAARGDETKITVTGLDGIVDIAQLDFLQDVMCDITDRYYEKLGKFLREDKPPVSSA